MFYRFAFPVVVLFFIAAATGGGLEASGQTQVLIGSSGETLGESEPTVPGENEASKASNVPSWKIETVRSGVHRGTPFLAFDPDGRPTISFSGKTHDLYKKDLMFARFDGSDWDIEIVYYANARGVGGSAGSCSTHVYGPDGNPAISYVNARSMSYRDNFYAQFDGTNWVIEPVCDPGDVRAPALAFHPDGHPAISYGLEYDLILARRTEGGWQSEVVVDSNVLIIDQTSLVFGPEGYPAISYDEPMEEKLWVARQDSQGWNLELVADTYPSSDTTLISSAERGFLIAYQTLDPPLYIYTGNRPRTRYPLMFASHSGTTWDTEVIAGNLDSFGPFTLALGQGGTPMIGFSVPHNDSSTDVRLGRSDGSRWTVETVGSVGDPMRGASLAFDPNGLPAICYFVRVGHKDSGALKFARYR